MTGPDLNLTMKEGSIMARECQYIVGRSREEGGSGSSGITTAYGIYVGLKACAKFLWGDENLKGKKIAVQGLGAVGAPLLGHLIEAGMEVVATDANEKGWGVAVVSGTGCNCRGWDRQHKREGCVTGHGILMGEGAGGTELVYRAMPIGRLFMEQAIAKDRAQ